MNKKLNFWVFLVFGKSWKFEIQQNPSLIFPFHLLPTPVHPTRFSFCFFPGFLAIFILSSNNNQHSLIGCAAPTQLGDPRLEKLTSAVRQTCLSRHQSSFLHFLSLYLPSLANPSWFPPFLHWRKFLSFVIEQTSQRLLLPETTRKVGLLHWRRPTEHWTPLDFNAAYMDRPLVLILSQC